MKNDIIKKFFFIILLVFPSLSAKSQIVRGDYLDNPAEEMSLIVGEVSIFNVNGLRRVSVRNPEIADIGKIEDTEITLIAISPGETIFTVWDKDGKRSFYITVYPRDLDRLEKKMKDLIYKDLGISSVYFKKNEVTGKLMIMGEVTPEEKEKIEKVLAPFLKKDVKGKTQSDIIENLLVEKETKMIEIDCEILELTKNWSDALGFDWTGTSGANATPVTTVTESLTNKAAQTGGKIDEVFRVVDWTRSALDVKIYAAVSQGKGKILARPKLLVLSGKEASFLVGGEIPVVTATSTSTSTSESVDYREYGVKLNIRPVVIGDNIQLDVVAEVKELSSEGQYVRSDGTVIKAFTTRTVTSSLILNPDQGVFISGLLKDKVTKDDLTKVPGLGDIPILGNLFKSRQYQNDQTELVITLTPKIINVRGEREKKEDKEKDYSQNIRPVVYPTYTAEKDVLNDYISLIQKKIYSALNYPELAEKAGWQGIVKLRLHLLYNGKLLDAFITESSGYLSFDDSVLKTVNSLSPYPQFPPNIEEEDLWIDIPIVYRID